MSNAEQGITTFTNVLQGHNTVALVWYTSEYGSWEGREALNVCVMCWKHVPYLKLRTETKGELMPPIGMYFVWVWVYHIFYSSTSMY